ncbi:MAG: putative addiction module component [Thermoanaerobaculia bacterium]|jgi:putative addiction module component (TIGR02574 family)|nr:putative addiction module component [Thermoanaerobaculia bacterium]
MERRLEQLYREALELNESERGELAGLLIQSLEHSPEPDIEEAWSVVAERRWREIESGSVQTVPWEEVRAKLYSQLDAKR